MFGIEKAFLKAFDDVCGTTMDNATLPIPEGNTFMLQPLLFKGSCKPATVITGVCTIYEYI